MKMYTITYEQLKDIKDMLEDYSNVDPDHRIYDIRDIDKAISILGTKSGCDGCEYYRELACFNSRTCGLKYPILYKYGGC